MPAFMLARLTVMLGVHVVLNEDEDHQGERYAEEQNNVCDGDKVDEFG